MRYKYKKSGSTILKEWTKPDFQNTPSTTNLEEEEIVGAPGNDGNASVPEEVKRPNPWRKVMMMMISIPKILRQRQTKGKIFRQIWQFEWP